MLHLPDRAKRFHSLGILLFMSVVCATWASGQNPIDIGARLEPLADNLLIDTLAGAQHVLQSPQPAGVVLRFDAPWEGRYCGYVTVFRDTDRFRMYYRGLPEAGKDGSDNEVTCYAESSDGLQWSKPSLKLFEVRGTTENNVILANQAPYSHNFSPFKDTRPDCSAEEQYKAIAGTEKAGLAAFVSADGIHWRLAQAGVLTGGAFDSQNVAFWSAMEGCYVCYFRTWSKGQWEGYRWVSRSTSKDFLHWDTPVAMDKGDAPWEHIYTNETQPYFRAPHLYVSIAARFMPGRRVVSPETAKALGIEGSYGDDCSDNIFMTSRGGSRYDRTFMEGFIRPGIGPENWTSRTNYPAYGLVSTGDKEMSLYVQADYGQPAAHLVRYALRPDGFASVRAPYAGGELLTKPLVFAGDTLQLNFSTSAAGGMRVEVQSADGKPLDGFRLEDCEELVGNTLAQAVQWKGGQSLGALAGAPVRIRFVMKDADLFALQFARSGNS